MKMQRNIIKKSPNRPKHLIMLRLLFSIISILLVSGCSALIEKSAKYSKFALQEGYTRDDIIAELGAPETISEERDCDTKP